MYGSNGQAARARPQAVRHTDSGIRELWDRLSVGLGLLNADMQLLQCNTSLQRLLQMESTGTDMPSLFTLLGTSGVLQETIESEVQRSGRWQGLAQRRQQALRVEIQREELVVKGQATTAYALTVIDYTEDSKRLKELSDAKLQAELTDKAKSRFLSHMSHELRTPLNAILGFTQLMQVTGSLSGLQQDNLKEIDSAGTYLLRLINEILDLSRIEAGKITLNEENISLEHVLHECVALARPLATRKQVTVAYQLNTHRPLFNDHVRLKQVLINLLSNAVKYNREGGSVSIQCFDADANNIQIEVRDTGPGISHELQSGIFSPFERLGVDEKRIEGTGIGLMITRRLVQLMGGQIGVVSEPGRGSVFWLRLPAPGTVFATPRGKRQLVCIGMDSAYNELLQRIAGMRQDINLLVQPNLHEAIPRVLQYKPACVLMSATAAYELTLDNRNLKTLKNPELVVVEKNTTPGSGPVDRSLFTTVLSEHHDLPVLLELMDRFFTDQ